MVKKLGIFSDLHGDKQNLELILQAFEQLGISHSAFCGDLLYKTLADYTTSDMNKAHQIRSQLREESKLREDVLKGYISDEQLQYHADALNRSKRIGKKVAKSEYKDIRDMLYGYFGDNISEKLIMEMGNWDFREEFSEVFADTHLNAETRKLDGVNYLGLSGGGSLVGINPMTETAADNQDDQGYAAESWKKIFLGEVPINAGILFSHLPVTYGENVKRNGEPSQEILKNLYIQRKQAGLPVPENLEDSDVPYANIHGHNHGTSVKFDKETGMLMVSVGSCSRGHNHAVPNFMVADEFDENNKPIVFKNYQIFTLRGLSEVRLASEYHIDYENKEVETVEMDELLFSQNNYTDFKDNVASLDDNVRLAEQGLNVRYDLFEDNYKEMDLQLRHNLSVMNYEIEDTSEAMKEVFKSVGVNYLENKDLDSAVDEAVEELAKLACERLGGNYDLLKSKHTKYGIVGFIQTVFGVNYGTLKKSFGDAKVESLADVNSFGAEVINESSKTLSNMYQQHILGDIEAEDLQNMAELYTPLNSERKRDIVDKQEAIGLWAESYQNGLISTEAIAKFSAYEIIEDFEGKERTKEEIAEMFGFDVNEDLEEGRSANQQSTDMLPKESREQLRNDIESGNLPVAKDNQGNDYVTVPTQQGPKKIHLGDDLKDANYTAQTPEEIERDQYLSLGQKVMNGEVPVIKDTDGIEKVLIDPEKGSALPLDKEKMGITGDYQTLSPEDYQLKALNDQITSLRGKADQLEAMKTNNQYQLPTSVDNTGMNTPLIDPDALTRGDENEFQPYRSAVEQPQQPSIGLGNSQPSVDPLGYNPNSE